MEDSTGNKAIAAAFAAFSVASGALAALPPVPVPPENPITENKRVLGKILFFDEQLSTDNTMACATCHVNNRAGTDPRRVRHPGADGVFNNADDVLASPGVVRSDAFNDYLRDSVFTLTPQVTPRTANSTINAAYSPTLFWDGRATSRFADPVSGATLIVSGGALESQIVGPPVSSVEMAHDNTNWAQITTKLRHAKPLVTATNLPTDVAAALAGNVDYPTLFTRAFGDGAITAGRIAFAIATYERTLIADQSPWDRTQAGLPGGLTPQQQQGLQAFNASNCNACHTPPLFSDNLFHAVGVRPPAEDRGLAVTTGNNNDRGKFRTPSLRNVGLKTSFFHNGQLTTLPQVIGFYARGPGAAPQFTENQDPIMPTVNVPPPAAVVIQEFIQNGLTDPRVVNQTFPFDRAMLYSERAADRPVNLGGGVAGQGGIVPQIVAADPPFVGNTAFRIGLDRARGGGGTTARLVVSSVAPENGKLVSGERVFGPVTVNGGGGGGAGVGYATQSWPLKAPVAVQNQTLYAQWIVSDPAAPNGEAYSTVAQFRFFCGSNGCASSCVGDYNNDYTTTIDDIFTFLNDWFRNDIRTDLDAQGGVTVTDIFVMLNSWFAGCAG